MYGHPRPLAATVQYMRRGVILVLVLIASSASAEPTVKLDEVAKTVEAELAAKIDPRSPRGARKIVARIEKADIAIDGKALRAALAKLPVTVLEDREEDGALIVTVAAASGARAAIVLGPDGGGIAVTARPGIAKPPGACVPIANARYQGTVIYNAIDDRGSHRRSEREWEVDTRRLLDVDGDGLIDVFVPEPASSASCPDEFSYRVFVVRGACGHELGVVGPGQVMPDASPLGSTGYRAIRTHEASSRSNSRIPNKTTIARTFELVAGAYKLTDKQTSGGQCHHCARWHCTRKSGP
jgi:hypothetical protein